MQLNKALPSGEGNLIQKTAYSIFWPTPHWFLVKRFWRIIRPKLSNWYIYIAKVCRKMLLFWRKKCHAKCIRNQRETLTTFSNGHMRKKKLCDIVVSYDNYDNAMSIGCCCLHVDHKFVVFFFLLSINDRQNIIINCYKYVRPNMKQCS
jgi:hypothetical protein